MHKKGIVMHANVDANILALCNVFKMKNVTKTFITLGRAYQISEDDKASLTKQTSRME